MNTSHEAHEIVAEFDNYIRRSGNVYSSWYVGITGDPRVRLFNDHNVEENGDSWIHQDCRSASVSRQVEKHFVNAGCQGGGGGGDVRSRYVYAYKTAPHTNENA